MIKITKDGRTIRTGKDYSAFREQVFVAQAGHCSSCNRITLLGVELESAYSFHVHHKNGRGMGGGKRDDTMGSCVGLCGGCHRSEHNQ